MSESAPKYTPEQILEKEEKKMTSKEVAELIPYKGIKVGDLVEIISENTSNDRGGDKVDRGILTEVTDDWISIDPFPARTLGPDHNGVPVKDGGTSYMNVVKRIQKVTE